MKKYIAGALSLLGLAGAYLVVRFPLFPFHGMKEWPLTLFIVGAVIIAVSTILRRKILPILTLVGYLAGFIAGYIFQFDYGVDLNNLWIIWTCVYLCTILVGIAAEIFRRKRKAS